MQTRSGGGREARLLLFNFEKGKEAIFTVELLLLSCKASHHIPAHTAVFMILPCLYSHYRLVHPL